MLKESQRGFSLAFHLEGTLMTVNQLYKTGKLALEIGMLLIPEARIVTGLALIVRAYEKLPQSRRKPFKATKVDLTFRR